MNSVKIDPIHILGIQAGAGGQKPGAEGGPDALRTLGLLGRLKADGHEVTDLGNVPGVYRTDTAMAQGRSVKSFRNVLQFNRHTHAAIVNSLRQTPGAFLLIVGGDHSLAIGTLAGMSDVSERLGILWIDAHPDFNTPATSPSGNLHGMSLAVACGHGQPDLRMIASRDPMVAEQNVYMFGIREIDAGEQEQLDASAVTYIVADPWREAGITSTVLEALDVLASRCDRVHLSFDIDVLDPQFVPGTGTPVPGGLTAEEALELLGKIGASGKIHSAEFVEYNPMLDRDDATGRLTIDLIAALMGTV